jgi:putative ABC transport system substrate-binding protein
MGDPASPDLGRRQFVWSCLTLAGLGVLSGCGVLPPQLLAPKRVPRVGYLVNRPPEGNANWAALRTGLAELGYVEARDITLEYRVGATPEQYPMLITELLGLPVDVLASADTNAVLAAKAATSTVPIVLTGTGDPVAAGLVASYSHPGGNVTGLTATPAVPLYAKELQLLTEAVPGIARVGFLQDGSHPAAQIAWRELQGAAQELGLAVLRPEIRADADFPVAFAALVAQQADALILGRYPLTFRNLRPILDFAATTRLPAMYPIREYVEAGGLMTYGVSDVDLHRRAAAYIDKVLKGTRPADLPIERPDRFDFVINLQTAQALGLSIPPSVLQQASEVIQ